MAKYLGVAFLFGVGWLLAVLFGGFGALLDCAMVAAVILWNWDAIKANYRSPDAIKAREAFKANYRARPPAKTEGKWDAAARNLGQRASAFRLNGWIVYGVVGVLAVVLVAVAIFGVVDGATTASATAPAHTWQDDPIVAPSVHVHARHKHKR